jgi:hypothetical protein
MGRGVAESRGSRGGTQYVHVFGTWERGNATYPAQRRTDVLTYSVIYYGEELCI